MTVPDLTAFTDLGVFTPAAGPEAAKAFYDRWGFVVLRDLVDADLIDAMETECVAAQRGVLAGELDARYGSRKYLDDERKAERFVNYVDHIEELAPAIGTALATPALVDLVTRILGPGFWPGRDGVVYQDARPGRESGYTRIGWHADWQAIPHLDIWPATAFTFHIDGTSPANGFLRVVPGSHLWATACAVREHQQRRRARRTPASRRLHRHPAALADAARLREDPRGDPGVRRAGRRDPPRRVPVAFRGACHRRRHDAPPRPRRLARR